MLLGNAGVHDAGPDKIKATRSTSQVSSGSPDPRDSATGSREGELPGEPAAQPTLPTRHGKHSWQDLQHHFHHSSRMLLELRPRLNRRVGT